MYSSNWSASSAEFVHHIQKLPPYPDDTACRFFQAAHSGNHSYLSHEIKAKMPYLKILCPSPAFFHNPHLSHRYQYCVSYEPSYFSPQMHNCFFHSAWLRTLHGLPDRTALYNNFHPARTPQVPHSSSHVWPHHPRPVSFLHVCRVLLPFVPPVLKSYYPSVPEIHPRRLFPPVYDPETVLPKPMQYLKSPYPPLYVRTYR